MLCGPLQGLDAPQIAKSNFDTDTIEFPFHGKWNQLSDLCKCMAVDHVTHFARNFRLER